MRIVDDATYRGGVRSSSMTTAAPPTSRIDRTRIRCRARRSSVVRMFMEFDSPLDGDRVVACGAVVQHRGRRRPGPAPNPAIAKSARGKALRIEHVPAVDDQAAADPQRDVGGVDLGELTPLGEDHE